MHLSKSERIYKKRLFRHIKVKKKSKQKELTAIIIKSPIYKRGGFKNVYFSIKNSNALFWKLSNAMVKVIYAFRSAGKSIMQLAQALKIQENKNKKNKLLGYGSKTVVVDEIPFERVAIEEDNND